MLVFNCTGVGSCGVQDLMDYLIMCCGFAFLCVFFGFRIVVVGRRIADYPRRGTSVLVYSCNALYQSKSCRIIHVVLPYSYNACTNRSCMKYNTVGYGCTPSTCTSTSTCTCPPNYTSVGLLFTTVFPYSTTIPFIWYLVQVDLVAPFDYYRHTGVLASSY